VFLGFSSKRRTGIRSRQEAVGRRHGLFLGNCFACGYVGQSRVFSAQASRALSRLPLRKEALLYDRVLTVSQALLPLITALISHSELAQHLPILETPAQETKTSGAKTSGPESYWLLAVLTVSASVTLAIYTIPTTFALGLSSVIFTAAGLVTFESTIRASTGGAQPQRFAALRDVAVAITVVCGVASLLIESSLTASTISWEPVYREYNQEWRDVHSFRTLQRFLWMIPVQAVLNVLTFFMVRNLQRRHPRFWIST
jgi:hypothetical protein